MKLSQRHKESLVLASRTMERLHTDGAAPTPENYSVWYSYFSDRIPDLTRAINDEIACGPLTEKKAERLFRRFFTAEAESMVIRETNERARSVLESISGVLETVGIDTGHYGRTLEDFQHRLDRSVSTEDLKGLIASVAAETATIVERQTSLQSQLSESERELAEMRQRLDRVQRESLTDGLTGLANRKAFDAVIADAVFEAGETGASMALLMMDIDYFKAFNDTYGHPVGDHVLRIVAKEMAEIVKAPCTPARYGGEEFAVVLPGTDLSMAVATAEAVRRAVAARRITSRTAGKDYGTVFLSAGAAALRPGESPNELIERADRALYAAKKNGRNCVKVAD